MVGEYRLEELLEEYNQFLTKIKTVAWTEQKTWSEFVAAFKMPQWDAKNLEQRITTNFAYYRANYICICAAIISLQILFAPVVFLVVAISLSLCIYVLIVRKKPIIIGNMEITGELKQYGCACITFLIMALSGVMVKLLWVALYSVVICFLHMLFRPRSVSSKTDKIYEDLHTSSGSSGWHDPEGGSGSFSSDAAIRKRGYPNAGSGINLQGVFGTGTGKSD